MEDKDETTIHLLVRTYLGIPFPVFYMHRRQVNHGKFFNFGLIFIHNDERSTGGPSDKMKHQSLPFICVSLLLPSKSKPTLAPVFATVLK